MGDQLRFETAAPRGLSSDDFRTDSKPKVNKGEMVTTQPL
jgi:hypothetical protein